MQMSFKNQEIDNGRSITGIMEKSVPKIHFVIQKKKH